MVTTKKSAQKKVRTTHSTANTEQAKPAQKTAVKKTAVNSAKKTSAKKSTKEKTPEVAQQQAVQAAAKAMKDIIARARDHFRTAPKENTFFVADGQTIKDLRELAEVLEEMTDHVFGHHVNDERHDFANWVHEVLQERALAEQLREAHRHPQANQRVIYRHIVRRAW